MRFKAKLMSDQLAVFHSVIAPISKLQDPHRFAVLYLDKEYIRLSCKTSEGITCFAELSQKELFVEHRIESAAENVIVCQVDLVSFKVALQSVVQSGSARLHQHQHQDRGNNNGGALPSVFLGQQQCVLKLAKRNQMPCLCLEGRSTSDNDVEIHQAIPVTILRAQEMQNHLPPQINHPQVQLELPPMNRAPIRAVIDKLKGMAKCVLLEGTMKGDFTIRIDHEGASMACFYNNLIPRWQDEEEYDDENDDGQSNSTRRMPNANASCVLKVDTHKLSTCLQWQQNQLPITSCLLGMVYNEMLVLHVLLAPEQVGFFTYYLPVHFLQEDEDMAT